MKQNVSPVVVVIAIVVVLAIVIKFGWSALGPKHEAVDKPFDMGKMMKDKMAPPPVAGPRPNTTTTTPTTP